MATLTALAASLHTFNESVRPTLIPRLPLGTVSRYMIAVGFAILFGLAAILFWGISGLILVGALCATAIIVRAVISCLSSRQLQLDPAKQLHPDRPFIRQEIEHLAKQTIEHHQKRHLWRFVREIVRKIYLLSLHFDNKNSIYKYLKNRFTGLDYSQLQLLSLQPVRFSKEKEGYELIIQSAVPDGWIRFYVSKENDFPICENVINPCRISKVTPFLANSRIEENHFRSFRFPFDDTLLVRDFLLTKDIRMDLTQVQVESIENIRYRCSPNTDPHDGYKIHFKTPNGLIHIYTDLNGYHVKDETSALDVVPR